MVRLRKPVECKDEDDSVTRRHRLRIRRNGGGSTAVIKWKEAANMANRYKVLSHFRPLVRLLERVLERERVGIYRKPATAGGGARHKRTFSSEN